MSYVLRLDIEEATCDVASIRSTLHERFINRGWTVSVKGIPVFISWTGGVNDPFYSATVRHFNDEAVMEHTRWMQRKMKRFVAEAFPQQQVTIKLLPLKRLAREIADDQSDLDSRTLVRHTHRV